ncbi:hypothetical protein NLG97_g2134 [Lecanicillium saksenae]|uniref:Uncharacterized protein n=1 Tax=Lecanicillium saksenae TaxID=468837 RepID=A0ACC1R374_9HYPO|nr:hypothetical protein NLG97_g2134 [Lecanicillium saksenae]
MDLYGLSSTVKPPIISELSAVWDLQRVASAIEYCILSDEKVLPEDRSPGGAPEDPKHMGEWQADIHKALYRSLILGAALAGVYQEPWHDRKPGGIAEAILECTEYGQTEEPEISFISDYPALQVITTLQQDSSLFSSLDQWLLDDILADSKARDDMAHRFQHNYGRAKECVGAECGLTLASVTHSDAHLVIWELFKTYWATEQLIYCTTDTIGPEFDLSEANITPPKGVANVVLFQRFSPVRMSDPVLTTNFATAAYGDRIRVAMEEIVWRAAQPTHYEDGRLVAPLHTKFFEHFLRQHFDLRFHICFFDTGDYTYPGGNSDLFDSLGLFARDDVLGRTSAGFGYYGDISLLTGMEFIEQAGDYPTYSVYGS